MLPIVNVDLLVFISEEPWREGKVNAKYTERKCGRVYLIKFVEIPYKKVW